MPIAKLRNTNVDYVLECDRELKPEEQTTFVLTGLNPIDAATIQDDMAGSTTYAMNSIVAVRKGLKNWKNYNDADGKPVKFKQSKDNFIDSNLDFLEQEHIIELGTEIMRLTFPGLFEDEDDSSKN